jgi:uncharacterized protein DUF547
VGLISFEAIASILQGSRPLDGLMTLAPRLENDVIRPLGDERVHFALNCMSVSCPRLPREPFRPEHFDQTLEQMAREFFTQRRNLEVLPERKLVRVSSILKIYRDDFLAKSPTLIAYINRYVRRPIADAVLRRAAGLDLGEIHRVPGEIGARPVDAVGLHLRRGRRDGEKHRRRQHPHAQLVAAAPNFAP